MWRQVVNSGSFLVSLLSLKKCLALSGEWKLTCDSITFYGACIAWTYGKPWLKLQQSLKEQQVIPKSSLGVVFLPWLSQWGHWSWTNSITECKACVNHCTTLNLTLLNEVVCKCGFLCGSADSKGWCRWCYSMVMSICGLFLTFGLSSCPTFLGHYVVMVSSKLHVWATRKPLFLPLTKRRKTPKKLLSCLTHKISLVFCNLTLIHFFYACCMLKYGLWLVYTCASFLGINHAESRTSVITKADQIVRYSREYNRVRSNNFNWFRREVGM